jgi:DNA-binding transcriptional MerR regulator/effector-binding domain-containing protein
MKDVMSAGELSALFNINVQTLHYYDSIGLMTPAVRDEETGRRKYYFEQVYKLASILYMKKIGYSLKQIKEHMESRQPEYTLEHMKLQSEALRKKTQELMAVDSVIQRKIRFIEQELRFAKKGKVSVRNFPKRGYISIGEEEILFQSDSFYFYPTIVFYVHGIKRFGAYIFLEQEDEEMAIPEKDNPLYATISEGDYLCGYHYGHYDRIKDSATALREAGEAKGLKLSDTLINLNIVDQFTEQDSEKYITILQIPILDTAK